MSGVGLGQMTGFRLDASSDEQRHLLRQFLEAQASFEHALLARRTVVTVLALLGVLFPVRFLWPKLVSAEALRWLIASYLLLTLGALSAIVSKWRWWRKREGLLRQLANPRNASFRS